MIKEKFRDSSLSPEERAENLVSQLTIEEQAAQLSYNAPAVPRLNIPAYNWWNEALHGVARGGTATMFPQAIGLAAIFDEEYLREIGDIIAVEARAKYNQSTKYGDRDIYKGLTLWSPNINIFRDPRWGRGHETYGEDPYLTGRLGVGMIQGLQGEDKVLKTAACAKHFAVHSGPEDLRHAFDAIATPKDMEETYLPAFEQAVKEGKVEAVMGAYNRVNGEPACGSPTLLQKILRDRWGFQGHVVSDCWALIDFHTDHGVTKTAPESAALAITSGCDLNCGSVYLQLLIALQEGLITEEYITQSAQRVMSTRIRLGMLDETTPFDSIPFTANDSREHGAKSLEAAEKSMVLLKNNGILPLDKTKLQRIGVIGPNADSIDVLIGNYAGTASGYTTFLQGIQQEVGQEVEVLFSQGCHLFKESVTPGALPDDRLSEALAVAEHSDVVILCLGLDGTIEGEQGDTGNFDAGGDKRNLALPGRQQHLLEQLVALGKPVVLVLGTGSALAVDYADQHCAALLNTWYPGSHGGSALANLLFGKVSPSGKLPVTFYSENNSLPEFTDYSMENRTYRFMKEKPLYPFGYGLTYSTVTLSSPAISQRDGAVGLTITVEITNTGDFPVEEVVQCYVNNVDSPHRILNHFLCGFQRVSLEPTETVQVSLEIPRFAFEVVTPKGERIIDGERFVFTLGISQPDLRSCELTSQQPHRVHYTLENK